MRWGQERVALCLQRQRDIYSARAGRIRGILLTAIQLAGPLLRAGYYTARSRLGGKKAAAYEADRQYAVYSAKALFAIATGRR
jgi:hypothetical protein